MIKQQKKGKNLPIKTVIHQIPCLVDPFPPLVLLSVYELGQQEQHIKNQLLAVGTLLQVMKEMDSFITNKIKTLSRGKRYDTKSLELDVELRERANIITYLRCFLPSSKE